MDIFEKRVTDKFTCMTSYKAKLYKIIWFIQGESTNQKACTNQIKLFTFNIVVLHTYLEHGLYSLPV